MPSVRGRRGITIVIAFRGKPYLGRLVNCLRSLVRQTIPPTEIIVSEQDEDGVAAGICEEVGATHILTKKREIFNKSAALNVGIKHSKTIHVYLLDADVILSPHALEEAKAQVELGRFTMLAARRASVSGHAGWERALRLSWRVDWARTCFGLLNATTRSSWFKIRGYHEGFFGWGFEDTYVVWRAEFLKIPVSWVEDLGVHQEHERAGEYDARREENRLLLEKMKRSRAQTRWGEDRVVSSVPRIPVPTPVQLPSFHVAITTYNRPSLLMNLLSDLWRESEDLSIEVVVHDDASTEDYSSAAGFLRDRGWEYKKYPKNFGKDQYWELINEVLGRAQKSQAQYFVQLPDDVRLCNSFFDRAVSTWRSIPDQNKGAMNLLKDGLRRDLSCWTGVRPERAGSADLTGWMDMCYLSERRLFEELGWSLSSIGTRDPNAGSGVGQQVSSRAVGAGLGLYRSANSLVVHVAAESKMHRDIRLDQSMRVVDFADGREAARRLEALDTVTASLASIPSRKELLLRTVSSLLPQVDCLNVYLNGYFEVPLFLHDPKIQVARSQDSGDLGDSGKFWWCEETDGFHLTCDDDLIYPPDYVDKMLMYLEYYGRAAAVGAHGSRIREKVTSYYASRKVFPCLGDVADAERVHVLGTGVLAYHTSTIKITKSMFELPNMADVWFALAGQDQKIPFVCIPHEKGWIEYQKPESTIYQDSKNRDEEQTRVVCSREWSLWPL